MAQRWRRLVADSELLESKIKVDPTPAAHAGKAHVSVACRARGVGVRAVGAHSSHDAHSNTHKSAIRQSAARP